MLAAQTAVDSRFTYNGNRQKQSTLNTPTPKLRGDVTPIEVCRLYTALEQNRSINQVIAHESRGTLKVYANILAKVLGVPCSTVLGHWANGLEFPKMPPNRRFILNYVMFYLESTGTTAGIEAIAKSFSEGERQVS